MPDGSVLRYQYDAAHRLTEIADSLGNVIQYTLDAMGNRIKEDIFDPTDRLQRTQRRVYDALNRLYNDIDASGQKSTYSYDANGNLKTSTDPLDRSTTLNYDALNRLLNSTDAAGGVTRYGYDAKDRLVVGAGSDQSDHDLHVRWARQSRRELASPDTGIATYVPDAAGNVVGSTDARGLATSVRLRRAQSADARDVLGRQRRARVRQHGDRRRVREGAADQGDRSVGHHDVSVRCVGSRRAQDADGRRRRDGEDLHDELPVRGRTADRTSPIRRAAI